MFVLSDSGAVASTVSGGLVSNGFVFDGLVPGRFVLAGFVPSGFSPTPLTLTGHPPAVPLPPSSPSPEQVRHLLFGSLPAVQGSIHQLYHLRYAEPNDWSRPISTGRPNEVMAILTKRV